MASRKHIISSCRLATSVAVSIILAALCGTGASAQTADPAAPAIAASIAAYPGVCACPYSLRRNGKKCGRASAWSKPGGQPVICYPSDLTTSGAASVAGSRPADPQAGKASILPTI